MYRPTVKKVQISRHYDWYTEQTLHCQLKTGQYTTGLSNLNPPRATLLSAALLRRAKLGSYIDSQNSKFHHVKNRSGSIESKYRNALYFGFIISLIQIRSMKTFDFAGRTKLLHRPHAAHGLESPDIKHVSSFNREINFSTLVEKDHKQLCDLFTGQQATEKPYFEIFTKKLNT